MSAKSMTHALVKNQSYKGGADAGGRDEVVKVGSGKPGILARAERACKRFGTDIFEACRSAIFGLRVPDDLDPGKALFVLGPDNKVRQACAAVVHNPGFDRFILLLISVSSLALALDSPLRDPDSATARYLKGVERVMTALFFIEMALKICAHGFVLMPKAYLRSAWNVLDFVVVVISMIQLVTNDSGNLESLRSLRTLRALRPLRYVNGVLLFVPYKIRNEGLLALRLERCFQGSKNADGYQSKAVMWGQQQFRTRVGSTSTPHVY